MDPPQATSLVVGTIIGVGIFTVAASLASHGPPPGPPPPVDAVSAASVGG